MNLKVLSKRDLDGRIKTLAQAERELLHDVILTIKEIDSRRMFLDFGYPNLYEYLVEEVKYLGGSAQRRIDAARLLKDVPEAGEKIRSGELTLGQITLVQKAIRQVIRTQSKTVSSEDKLDLINQISNLTESESEKEVSLFFELPIIQNSKRTVQRDGSVRYEFTMSAESEQKFQQAQGHLSHAVPTREIGAFLDHVVDKIIKQKTSVRSPKQELKNTDNSSAEIPTARLAMNSLAVSVKKSVLKQQSCCQYKDPVSGRACQSKWFNQIDHRQAKWAGGSDDLINLQVLCASHNQAKYRKEAGIGFR